MTNELGTISEQKLATLRNTIAPGLTDAEFGLFAEIVKATGLNPVTKEIWAIKAGGRLQLMTGINGFLRIANSHPAFDGMEVSFEWDGKTLLSCTVKVHRKDRKFPAVATAWMNEYSKPTPIWKQMPSVMLAKCAKSLAIREAFIQELGGLYTIEEMPANYAPPKEVVDVGNATLATVDVTTGEIVSEEKDDIPTDWNTKAVNQKARTTYYTLGTLTGDKKEAAVKYLEANLAKEIDADVWQSPIRLDKLTSCIIENYEA
jgi:phage recombination protein Bet